MDTKWQLIPSPTVFQPFQVPVVRRWAFGIVLQQALALDVDPTQQPTAIIPQGALTELIAAGHLQFSQKPRRPAYHPSMRSWTW